LSSKTDVTKSYIDWAIDNDFAVIDVNIPKFVAVESEEVSFYFQIPGEWR
jgi:histone deacetylase 6